MKKIGNGVLGLLFWAGTMLSAQSSVAQLEYDLAQVRIEQARKAFFQDQVGIAHQLLHQSSEFTSNLVEYYELHGLILFHDGRYASAMESFEKVLDFPQLLHRSLEAEHQLLSLYYRSGQYEKLLALTENTSLRTADAFFYRNMALAQTGSDALIGATQEAMALWPYDYRFYLPVLGHEQFGELFLANFSLLSRRVARHSDAVLTLDECSMFVASLRRVEGANQLQLVKLAQAWLAQDLNYVLLLRWVSYQKALADYEDQLLRLEVTTGAEELDIPEPMLIPEGLLASHINIELLLPGDDLGVLGRSASLWAVDRNKDGYIDAWGRLQLVSRGASYQWLPLFWVEDAGQMGQSSRAVFYRADGQPFYVLEQYNKSLVSLVIEDFPYVNQVRIESLTAPVEITEELIINQMQEDSIRARRAGWLVSDSPRSLVYQIALTSLALDYVPKGLQIPGSNSMAVPYFSEADPLLSGVNLLAVSYRMHEYMDNQLFRLLQMVDGQVVALWEDSGKEGFFSRFLAFQKGVPLYGRRAFMREEGYVLYEHYESGVWQGVAFGPSSAGFDFYEEWSSDDLLLKVWDFEPDDYINVYTITDRRTQQPNEVQANFLNKQMLVSEKLAWDFPQALRWFNEQRD